LPVSAIVYIWACRSLDLEADRLQAYEADIGLDPDADPMAFDPRTKDVSAGTPVATTTGGS
jgi:plastocyanin